MENQYQKWVNLSYLAFAALIGYLVFALSLRLEATFELESKVKDIDLIIRAASVVVSGIVFLVLTRNQQANQFMNEVMIELSRVTWPTSNDTTKATFIVVIMVLITGAILGALDQLWTVLIQKILA